MMHSAIGLSDFTLYGGFYRHVNLVYAPHNYDKDSVKTCIYT